MQRKTGLAIALLLLIPGVFGSGVRTAPAQDDTSSQCIDVDYEFPQRTSDVLVDSDIEVNPVDGTLAVARRDGIYIYNVETLELTEQIQKGSDGFDLSWSPDGHSIALASYHFGLGMLSPLSQLQIWDSGVLRSSVNTESGYVAWSPDGQFLATSLVNDGTGGLAIWDAHNLELITQLDTGMLDQIVWLPDSAGVLATIDGQLNSFWLWQESSGLERVTIDNDIYYTAAQAKQSRIAFVTGFPGIEVWDSTTKDVVATLRSPGYRTHEYHYIYTAEWSPDGADIALGTREGLFLWRLPDPEAVTDYTAIAPPTYRIAWAPDGAHLFFSDFDGGVYRWDIEKECVTGRIEVSGGQ